MTVFGFAVNEEKERPVILTEFRSDFDCDMELPALINGLFFLLLKMRAAERVGTAPCLLFRRTRCTLPGTEGQEATPRRPSWLPGVWKRLGSTNIGAWVFEE